MSPPADILTSLAERVRAEPSGVAYYARERGTWRGTDWQRYADAVRDFALGLVAAGLEPGARVAIVSNNRPEWSIAYLGAMSAGCVPVGVAPALAAQAIAGLVARARVALTVLESEDLAGRPGAAARHEFGALVALDAGADADAAERRATPWRAFLERGRELDAALLERRAPGEIAALAFSAGTTGAPALRALSHENLSFAADALARALAMGPADRLLSYLPLGLPVEQLMTIHIPIRVGALVYYATSLGRAAAELGHVRPTVFVGVPAVWREMRASVAKNLSRTRGRQRALIDWARRTAAGVHQAGGPSRAVGARRRLAHGVARYLVLSKIERALGLGDTRVRLCTGGPLPDDVRDFFASLDLPVSELYGQVELCQAVCVARPGEYRPGTVGTPLDGVEVRVLAPREMPLGERARAAHVGEIAVCAPRLVTAYIDDDGQLCAPEPDPSTGDSERAWSRTGDLGRMDEAGALSVLGRADQALHVDGETVLVEPLEAALAAHDLVRDALVVAHPRGRIAVILALDPATRELYSSEPGVERAPEDWLRDAALLAALRAIIAQVSGARGAGPAIEYFALAPAPATVDDGGLTPTLGPARATLRARAHGPWLRVDQAGPA